MAFSLTVQEGKDIGRQEQFEQSEIFIGRTSDNSFILLDPGVSRKHASILQENGKTVIRDLGSANGVAVNGNSISSQQLNSGDKIALGPVVLLFEEISAERNVKRRTQALPPRQQEAAQAESRRGTMTMQSVRRPRDNPRNESLLVPTKERRREDDSLSVSSRNRRRRSEPEFEQEGSEIEKSSAPSRLSASERARILRENKGLAGQIKLFLAKKTPATRSAIKGGMALFGISLFLVVGFLVKAKLLDDAGGQVEINDSSETHFSLTDSQERKVFGYGTDLGVTTQTRYELYFDFEVSETIPAIYYLYFDSSGIESSQEISISLNSVPIGNVNGGLGDYTKTQKIRLPKKHLIPGQINEILFDHMSNARGSGNEKWAISAVRLQQIPLPGCDARSGECEREAHQHYAMAEKLWATKQMAAENAYNSLKNLNTSLLFLEAVEPKPEFTRSVQQMIRDVERYLDSICSKTLLQVKRNEELRNYQKVVAELKNGLLWYPGPDHHCRGRLENQLAEYE